MLNVAVRAALFAQEHPLRQCERDLESDCGEMQKRIVHSGTLPALQAADLSARVYADRRLRSAQCSAQARAQNRCSDETIMESERADVRATDLQTRSDQGALIFSSARRQRQARNRESRSTPGAAPSPRRQARRARKRSRLSFVASRYAQHFDELVEREATHLAEQDRREQHGRTSIALERSESAGNAAHCCELVFDVAKQIVRAASTNTGGIVSFRQD